MEPTKGQRLGEQVQEHWEVGMDSAWMKQVDRLGQREEQDIGNIRLERPPVG